MKTMAGKAGFERRLTNHSARKRMMQKLNDNNAPPVTHFMQLSGYPKFSECYQLQHFVKRAAEKYVVDFERQFSPTKHGAHW